MAGGTSYSCLNGDVMIELAQKPQTLTVDGTVQSLHVYFREAVPIKEVVRFTLEHCGRVLVYVGQDGIPVALQFADPPPKRPPPAPRVDDMTLEQAVTILFGLASKMVAFAEAKRQRLGDMLIRDAIKVGERLPGLFGDEALTHN